MVPQGVYPILQYAYFLQEERLEILKALSRDIPLHSTADLSEIARSTENYTGADLKALLYSAQLRAVHRVLDEDRTDVKSSSSADAEATSETVDGRGHDEREPASSRVMVYRLSGPRCEGTQAEPELEERVM